MFLMVKGVSVAASPPTADHKSVLKTLLWVNRLNGTVAMATWLNKKVHKNANASEQVLTSSGWYFDGRSAALRRVDNRRLGGGLAALKAH